MTYADPRYLRAPAPPRTGLSVIVLLLVGAAVSVSLGVYGRVHTPTGVSVNISGFSGPLEVKVWLTSAAATGALVQLVTALMMYGKLPIVGEGHAVGALHRWSGRAAFLLTIPVAMHCLYALGFQTYDTRTLVHSLLGCAFFGAFTVKMLTLSRDGLPDWLLPLAGGVVFSLLVGLWLTSSLWFFTTTGVRF